jgi:predicted enzyme involved in methoxymalonyl-ACP biosynthesis
MVFFDDNPFERNSACDILPDVIVPELPDDPADYVKALSELESVRDYKCFDRR